MGHLLEQDSLCSSCAEVLLEVGTHRAQPARTEQHPKPEPGAVDSRATFLWLLLGNISRPFAVPFPRSEQTLTESVPLRGWIKGNVCFLQGPVSSCPCPSQMAYSDIRVGGTSIFKGCKAEVHNLWLYIIIT